MKKTILALTSVTLITTIGASAHPAMAQGPRFRFAENRYLLEEPNTPRCPHVSNSTVRAGSVPNASTMLGLNPNSFAPPAVSTQVSLQPPAPRVVPHIQPVCTPTVKNNPYPFGLKSQPARLLLKESPPSSRQVVFSKQNLGGTVLPPQKSALKSIPLAKRLCKTPIYVPPTTEKKVLNYEDRLIAPGSTHPATYSTGINSAAQVKGRLLPMNEPPQKTTAIHR